MGDGKALITLLNDYQPYSKKVGTHNQGVYRLFGHNLGIISNFPSRDPDARMPRKKLKLLVTGIFIKWIKLIIIDKMIV